MVTDAELREQLTEQDHFLQTLVDSSVNCIIVLDKSLRYLVWNKQTEALYGIPKEETLGKTVKEVFKDHDVRWFEDAVYHTLKGEHVKIADWRSQVTGLHYEMDLAPVKDTKGNIASVFVLIHDITAIKQQEEELKALNDRISLENSTLKHAEEMAQLGTWKYNLQNGTTYWSDGLYRLYGYEPGTTETGDDLFLECVHPEDRETVKTLRENVLESGVTAHLEFRIIRQDGELRYLEGSAGMSKNAKGQDILIGSVRDITAEYLLKRDLKEQKDFAEAIIQNSMGCIHVLDKDFRYVEWNKLCEDHYGKTREEVLGKTVNEVFPDVDMAALSERMNRVFEGEVIHLPAEPSQVLKDQYFECHMVPIGDAAGAIKNMLSVFYDVSDIINISKRAKEANRLLEQKNTELAERTAFLQTLLDTSPDLIGAYDRDLRLIAFNKASEKKYNLRKEDVLGKLATEVFPGIENVLPMQQLMKALNGETPEHFEYLAGDGSCYEGFTAPIRDSQQQITAVLAIAHDITELHKKNDELNRMNAEITSFSYAASHDLQEPLRKIQAFTSLVLAKDFAQLSASGQDYFKRIQASADRMQQMLEGLLSFSRANTAPKIFDRKDLNEVVKKVLTNMQEEILQKKAIIESDEMPSTEVITPQFEQLLQHLLSNALKFQPAGNTPYIQIKSSVVEGNDVKGDVVQRDKKYYRLSIKDNGVGFEPEEAEKIFQMFHRLHGKSEYPGTGIGLAICRRIVQNHNGIITPESTPGQGSVFHIFLPVTEDQPG